MRSLYIAHAGMTEPLGRSQILPYLFGLARRGADIEILSFEPEGTTDAALEVTRDKLRAAGISWRPRVRSARHDLPVKVWESAAASMQGLARSLTRRPQIIHARSYLPAAVADVVASLSPRAKLLFDCRGMLGDEYVDGGYWTKDRVEYKMLKRVESRLFRRTEGLVVLTKALRRWLEAEHVLGAQTQVAVIPCCVDLDRFKAEPDARAKARAEVGLATGELAVVYSGSLGNWYLENEMAQLFSAIRTREPKARFVVLSRSKTDSLRAAFAQENIPEDTMIFRSVTPDLMPTTLPLGDVGVSFIRPCFSKTGSSPTKVAEYLSAGMPAVLNGDIGDQGDLRSETQACAVVSSFDRAALERAADEVVELAKVPFEARREHTRAAAERHFSLEKLGVPRYEALYRALSQEK